MKVMFLYFFFLLLPVLNPARLGGEQPLVNRSSDIYASVNLLQSGLSRDVFDLAVRGLQKLNAEGKLQNSDIVTIADYSQSSNKKRLYVIDLKNRKLLFNTYVAHGRNTGDEYARNFSNEAGSLKSSLGFYVTENPLVGSHTGYALMINGVEKGFNDNACKREIIIHAADYASEKFIKKYGRLGRSFGCPALPPDLNKPIIDTIKGGTCLFIYTPDNNYIASSSLLN
ncbi:MAG: murein L,D-transpeptidase catalytic domain family protein [Bacteroidales bacterium]|jgi:hypothetical protein